ncbi:MAG: hypothetical protein HPAVJP_0850 [Candidatus Hepatoplasma vulgare]|nr:MAG: hypothetical protein HPAVJP_0850 [Candidatus Hepatoplasma sp.]
MFELNCLALESFRYKVEKMFLTNEKSDDKEEKKLPEIWNYFKNNIVLKEFVIERIINYSEIDKIEKIISECHENQWIDLQQYFNNSEKNFGKIDRYHYLRIDKNIKIIFYFQEKNQKIIYYPLLLDLHHSILGKSYKKYKKLFKWNFNSKREKMQLELNNFYLSNNFKENYLPYKEN